MYDRGRVKNVAVTVVRVVSSYPCMTAATTDSCCFLGHLGVVEEHIMIDERERLLLHGSWRK
jgi:hypothetical protein